MEAGNYQIQKDYTTITQTVITNIVKMISYRGWLKDKDENYISDMVNDLIKNKKDEKIYNIKLSENLANIETYNPSENKSEWKNFDGTQIYIFLSEQVVSGKSSVINDFMAKYSKFHRIVVVKEITDKEREKIYSQNFAEIFKEYELMINLTSHHLSPQYEVLNKNEEDRFLEEYCTKKNKLPRMLMNDPASRYLYLRRGQIVRMVRSNITTSNGVGYRVVK